MTKSYVKNYPRPQFVRDNWKDLSGHWNFRFDDEGVGYKNGWYKGFEDRKILVPFTYESEKSGIQDQTHHQTVWYSLTVDLDFDCADSEYQSKALHLHFEGADYESDCWVNGHYLGNHQGGYSRFSFAIEDFVQSGENTIVLRCKDRKDKAIPRGKQRWMDESYACWYVQSTGIWKQVWLEELSRARIDSVKNYA